SMTDVLSLRTAALRYAARGWHVFPLWPGSKVPAVPDAWQTRATADPALIGRWWSGRPFNIGLAVGPSGLFVIDLDGPKPARPAPRCATPRAAPPAPSASTSTPEGTAGTWWPRKAWWPAAGTGWCATPPRRRCPNGWPACYATSTPPRTGRRWPAPSRSG